MQLNRWTGHAPALGATGLAGVTGIAPKGPNTIFPPEMAGPVDKIEVATAK